MTPRRRLSIAMRKAAEAAEADRAAQAELHNAFEAVYGFDLDIEELGVFNECGDGDVWVDGLVYGQGMRPSLGDLDKAVQNKQQTENEE